MVTLSRIYTKTGDDGTTGLGDGHRVPKDSLRVIACGDVDELNANLGCLLAQTPGYGERSTLERIMNELFDLGADLCCPWSLDETIGSKLRVSTEQVLKLEADIDRLNANLKPLNSFVLPGGSPAAGWLHVARTVCRRAERSVVSLYAVERGNMHVLHYINRLSDLLFVMARVANDDGRADVLWQPGKSQLQL